MFSIGKKEQRVQNTNNWALPERSREVLKRNMHAELAQGERPRVPAGENPEEEGGRGNRGLQSASQSWIDIFQPLGKSSGERVLTHIAVA